MDDYAGKNKLAWPFAEIIANEAALLVEDDPALLVEDDPADIEDDPADIAEINASLAHSHLHHVAQTLGGSPAVYPDSDLPILLALQVTGHAADFGEEGWARGHHWHEKYGR